MTAAPLDHDMAPMRAVQVESDGHGHGRLAQVRGLMRSPSALGQFVRFVVVGGSTNVVYALAFVGLVGLVGLGEMTANAIGVITSTVLANELHRRLTFRAADRVGWIRTQWEAGGLSVLALLASSAALAGSEAVAPDAAPLVDAAVVIASTGLIGLARFFALRGWVFSARSRKAA